MRFAAAVLVAAFAAVALGIALAFAGGGLVAWSAALALAGGALVGALAFRQMPPSPTGQPIHIAEWGMIGVFALASLRAFLWLLYRNDDELFILSPNNLGDIALHLDFIRYLASGVPFWPDSPILTGEPLKYPPGADFFNSLLLKSGLPVERGLVWTGLAGSALTAAALWRWGRGFALAAFLFGGGLAGFGWLYDAILTGNFTPQDVQAKVEWKNLFLALFVTQRGFLMALPAGLFLLDHWRARYLRGERSLLPTWAALMLYATMPLYNVHTFLFLSAALVGMFAFARDAAARKASLLFAVAAFVPATICTALVTGGFAAGGGVHPLPGWMQPAWEHTWQSLRAIAWFWVDNFGLYLLLGIVLLPLALVRRSREQLALALPATAMFVLCAFVSFAVWPWDNTKILLWCWLAVAPGIWTEILRPLALFPRAFVCVVLFFTGALSLTAGLDGRHGYRLVDAGLVNETAGAVRGIAPNARFACAPEYWHPLILLGRKVTLGYEGHLFSHGLDYKPKMAELETLMDGDPGWEESARALGIDYLFWGEPEDDRWPGSDKPWAKKWPVAAHTDDFTIYRVPAAR
jgi:hypothetical protein